MENEKRTFEDDASWRQSIRTVIDHVWRDCAFHPASTMPDVVIEIREHQGEILQRRLIHESGHRWAVEPSLVSMEEEHQGEISADIDHSKVVYLSNYLGGRSDCTLIRLEGYPDQTFVLTSVGLVTYFRSRYQTFFRIAVYYHEGRTLLSLPQHPNIIRSHSPTVTVPKISNST